MRGLSFTAGGELYAVDVTLVQNFARRLSITPVPSAPAEIAGIANLKGKVITVLNLNRLLGSNDPNEIKRNINTIVFKSGSDTENQMGLAIEKPGNLIYADDDAIRSPPLAADAEENHHISGIIEIDDMFYRIIDIESISKKFIHSSDPISGNTSYGGNDNE